MLIDRYPDLHFRLLWEKEEKNELSYEEAMKLHGAEEIERFQKDLHLSEIEVLYIYGIGLGSHFKHLRSWLEENPRRKLVYLEDDLYAIDAAERFGETETFVHPQVFIRFIEGPRKWSAMLKQCAVEFQTARLDLKCCSAKATKKNASQLKLRLLRLSGLVDTYFNESIYAHIIHRNLLENLKHLSSAFDVHRLKDHFKGVPAIICGAGPSLKESIQTLKSLEDRALILAGGSAITALGNLGVVPHFAMAIDPNKEEVDRFEASVVQEVPFLFGHRVHPEVFDTFNAPLGYFPTKTGGSAESWVQKQLEMNDESFCDDLGPEALSISTLALALSYFMGCDPIIFVGIDLAYTGMHRYAPGVMSQKQIDAKSLILPREQLETMVKRKDASGNPIYTLVKWVMEADVFSKFAKKHPDRTFLRIGSQGLPMKGIPVANLEELAAHFSSPCDFLGDVHQIVQSAQFQGLKTSKIDAIKNDLFESVKRCEKICSAMIEEVQGLKNPAIFPTGKMMSLEMAFEEEHAYPCLFESVGFAFATRNQKERNLPALTLELELEKWNHLASVSRFYLKNFLECAT